MVSTLSTYFSCLSIGLAIFLLVAAVRFLFREKYAEGIAKLPDANRQRLVKVDQVLVRYCRDILRLFPSYLIVLPLALFYYLRELFWVGTICMVLFSLAILQEYFFRKWMIQYLETKEPAK